MSDDLREWVLRLMQSRDDKISCLAESLSSQKMAMKILGVGLMIFLTALVGFGFGLLATALKVWGNFG